MDRSIGHRGAFSSFGFRRLIVAAGLGIVGVIASVPAQAQEMCGGVTYPFPYTDVSGVTAPFCPGIMEAYVTGISKGTTPTTFSPNNDVTRLQMTTFLQRTVDQVLARGSRRAALNQWWTPQNPNPALTYPLSGIPQACTADGANIWSTGATSGNVDIIQANTGASLGSYVGAAEAWGILSAEGLIWVTGYTSPGELFYIDPTTPPGGPAVAVATLGNNSLSITFDGTNLWTANQGPPGSVSIITAAGLFPVTTVTAGFNTPYGILYDGTHIWVTDVGTNTLLKLDASGTVLQTVPVGAYPEFPVFDGANIWVPNEAGNSISVVQVSTGNVVATITSDGTNKLNGPTTASFDGERILVTNSKGDSVTLFKAADLSFIGNVSTGASTGPIGACSDGINFWVVLQSTARMLRL